MASPLTWRNVDAPNMAGSLEGTRLTAGLLSDATKDISAGLAGFGQAQQQQAGGIALQNAMKITDPNAYAAALADGSLLAGVDPAKVSPEVLQQLSDRRDALLTDQWKQNRNTADQYDFSRTTGQNANLDAATPILNQITAAEAQGNTALANQLRQQNADVLNGLTADQMANATKGNLALETTRLNNQGTALDNSGKSISNDQSMFNFTNAKSDRNDTRDGAIQANNILAGSIDANSARRNFNSLDPSTSPTERLLIANRLGEAYPELKGTLSVGGSGNSLAQTSGMTLGGGQLDPNIKTVGDLVDNKATLVKQNGGSPFGTYQITGDTWADIAPKVLGSNWRNADPRDPAVQDKVAEGIWNTTKGNAGKIKGRWDALTPAQAEQISKMPWDQAKQVIASAETNTDPSTILSPAQYAANTKSDVATNTLLSNTIDETLSGKNMNTLNKPEYFNSLKSDPSQLEVANTMAAKSTALKGASAKWISNQLDDIIARSDGKLSYAKAGVVLENSVKAQGSGLLSSIGNSYNNLVGNDDAGITLNQDGLDNRINQAITGAPLDQSVDVGNITAARDNVNATFASRQAVGDKIQQLQQQQISSGRPINPADMARLQTQYQTYDAQYRQALAKVQGNVNNLPQNIIKARQDAQAAKDKAAADTAARTQARTASQNQVPARVMVNQDANPFGLSQAQLDAQSAPGRQMMSALNYRPAPRQ